MRRLGAQSEEVEVVERFRRDEDKAGKTMIVCWFLQEEVRKNCLRLN